MTSIKNGKNEKINDVLTSREIEIEKEREREREREGEGE